MPELVFDPRRPRIRRNLLRGRVHYVGMEMRSHGDWKKILLAEKREVADPSRIYTRADVRTRILLPMYFKIVSIMIFCAREFQLALHLVFNINQVIDVC